MRQFISINKNTILAIAIITAIFCTSVILALSFDEINPIGFLKF